MAHQIAPNNTVNRANPAEVANQKLSEARADTIKMMIKNRPNVIKNDDKSILLSTSLLAQRSATHWTEIYLKSFCGK